MSLITDVVVVCMHPEADAIGRVNDQLAADESFGRQRLAPLDMSAAGGGKLISAQVYAASFNYGDIPSLCDYLSAAPWRFPDSVTITWDGEVRRGRIVPGGPPRRREP
jgi:hypothetical protein